MEDECSEADCHRQGYNVRLAQGKISLKSRQNLKLHIGPKRVMRVWKAVRRFVHEIFLGIDEKLRVRVRARLAPTALSKTYFPLWLIHDM